MRKIQLTESALIKLIEQIIKEAKHEFQNYEDEILDKISSDGIESLSDVEKNILSSISGQNFDTKPIMLMLAKKIAKQESLTDIEQMFYDEYAHEPEEEEGGADYGRELEPGVLYDAGDDEVPPSDDRDNRFSFTDPKGEIPTMKFDALKIYTTDKYIVFQGVLEIEYTTYYGKIYTDLDGQYLGYRFKSETQSRPDEDYESDIIEVFLKLASEQLNQDNEQQDEY